MDDHKVLQWALAARARRWLSKRALPPRTLFRLLDRFRHRPSGSRGQWANRALSRLVSAGLIAVLGWQLARITWTLVPGESPDEPVPVINAATMPAPQDPPVVDVQGIVDAHLFGQYVEPSAGPVAPILEAPETELNLQLKATVSEARQGRIGAAVIAGGGTERTYTVGEAIEGTDGAVLHAVHADRVILSLAGQFETLGLPRSDATPEFLTVQTAASGGLAHGSAVPNPFASPNPTVAVSELRQTLSVPASRLREFIHAVPHVEQGAVVGFRLDPRGEPAPFEALGLEPGDVVTEINGARLTHAAQAPEVFERLGETTQANVVLIRDGAPRVLSIDTALVQAPPTEP